jgi:hypothetical protein
VVGQIEEFTVAASYRMMSNELRNIIKNSINDTYWLEPNENGYIFEDVDPVMVDTIFQLQFESE